MDDGERRWTAAAIGLLRAERERVGPTPIRTFPLPPEWGITLRLKDESAQPTGGLKHRLARSLLDYHLSCGRIRPGRTLVEASGGGVVVAEAYFARLLGLPFVAVLPGAPSPARTAPVAAFGGECRFADPPLAIYDEARRLAGETGGLYVDHLAWAERAADWRGGDLAGELFAQLGDPPSWAVVGAGTGATSAALGRHLLRHGLPTRLAVADPENSAYFPGWAAGAADYATGMPSRIEGIGRPRMEPGFVPELIDLVVPVPDAASVAAARRTRAVTGLPVGGSTGAALWAALERVARMRAAGEEGCVVTVIADAGERHLATYHDDAGARGKGLDPGPYAAALDRFLSGGPWAPPG